jgi:hypothetical protein
MSYFWRIVNISLMKPGIIRLASSTLIPAMRAYP